MGGGTGPTCSLKHSWANTAAAAKVSHLMENYRLQTPPRDTSASFVSSNALVSLRVPVDFVCVEGKKNAKTDSVPEKKLTLLLAV